MSQALSLSAAAPPTATQADQDAVAEGAQAMARAFEDASDNLPERLQMAAIILATVHVLHAAEAAHAGLLENIVRMARRTQPAGEVQP